MEPIKSGNWFENFPFRISESGTPLNLTGLSIRIQFRRQSVNGPVQVDLQVGQGLTVTDATDGTFHINGFLLNWPEGTYYFDCLITDNGRPLTYFEGALTVQEPVTRPL